MASWEEVLRALPHAPRYRYDWEALFAMKTLNPFFSAMRDTHQHLVWHGEDDVMTHTRMVCDALAVDPAFQALTGREQQIVSLASLLHDIGKIRCTRMEDGIWVSPHHGPVGAQMIRAWLWREMGMSGIKAQQAFREAVCLLVRYHTLPLHLFEREHAIWTARRIAVCQQLIPSFSWHLLCMLSEADMRGRIGMDLEDKLNDLALSRIQAEEAGCMDTCFPFADAHTMRAYFQGRHVQPDQHLFDDSWGEVILMCGLPGTGKDTWISTHAGDLPVVCLDDLRRVMHVHPKDEQGAVVQAAKEQARGYLRAHQSFVWNATNLTGRRESLIHLFEQYGARVRIVYLETDWEENLRRNAERAACVPENVLESDLQKMEPPLPFEAEHVEWICV